jgi:hypothetical protein
MASLRARHGSYYYEVPKIFMVAPVYREFYNGNLGRLLINLARQSIHPARPYTLDVFFVVNNTRQDRAEIRVENQETVAFLQTLAARQRPRVRADDVVNRRAIEETLSSPFRIHVLDLTNPGQETRNIGRVRNIGNRYALNQLTSLEKGHTVIAQMDTDTGLPFDYAERLQGAFAEGGFDYALLDLQFQTEPDSEFSIFRRAITGQLDWGVYDFVDAQRSRLPLSGTPRIVMRAYTLEAIGGIPEYSMGEDTTLIRLLSESPHRGVFLSDLTVRPAYRGRDDGYDAAYFESQKYAPAEPASFIYDSLSDLEHLEAGFSGKFHLSGTTPEDRALWAEERAYLLNQKERETSDLLLNVSDHLHRLSRGTRPLPLEHFSHPLLASRWFGPYLELKFASAGQDQVQTLMNVMQDLPHEFTMTPENRLWVRFEAATRMLRYVEARQRYGIRVDGPAPTAPPSGVRRFVNHAAEKLRKPFTRRRLATPEEISRWLQIRSMKRGHVVLTKHETEILLQYLPDLYITAEPHWNGGSVLNYPSDHALSQIVGRLSRECVDTIYEFSQNSEAA